MVSQSPRARLASDRAPEELIRELCSLTREAVVRLADAVYALATHPVPQVRAEALGALLVTGQVASLRGTAVRAISRDGDEYVRAKAAFGIAATSTDETRREDLVLLLRVLRNEHETNEVRRSAYEALLMLFGSPEFPDSIDDFDPATDVDWGWIREIEMLYG
jgi:HEAT repeat protein